MKVLLQNAVPGFSKRFMGAALFSGLLGMAGVAQADPIPAQTVDITFNGGLFPKGYVGTRITYDQPGVSSTVDMSVAAGMFSGVASNPTGGFQLSSLYFSADNVLAYCVDILERLLTGNTGATYNVNDIPEDPVVDARGVTRDFERTLQFLGAANQVAKKSFGLTFADKNWLNPSQNWMAAAIQIGIWESLYEGETKVVEGQASSSVLLSTNSGWFTASTNKLGDQGIDFLRQSFGLMEQSSAVTLDAGQVKWLQINGGQDLLVDPVDVPAPAPLLLLLSGVALLLRRRA